MSRFFEDAQQQGLDEHVARELGISVDALEPYDIDEDASKDGVVYGWRVVWQGEPPAGVTASGPKGGQWSDVGVMHTE